MEMRITDSTSNYLTFATKQLHLVVKSEQGFGKCVEFFGGLIGKRNSPNY